MRATRTLTIVAVDAGDETNAQWTYPARQYRWVANANANGHDLVMRRVPQPVAGAGKHQGRVRATLPNRRDMHILNSDPGQGSNLGNHQVINTKFSRGCNGTCN